MKLDKLAKDKSNLSFVLRDADVGLANAFRRVALSEVPTLAIERIFLQENSSSLYDEMIAHRLGLVPIKGDTDLFKFRDQCSCEEGCPSCVLKLTLEKEGPCTVYSHDLKSEDPKQKPVPNIPIVKLGKSQRIKLEADAVLGNGKMHAKWQSCVVGYKYLPIIEISGSCDLCENCIEQCPKDILKVSRNKLTVTDEKECILCNACVEVCESEAIKVRGDERSFIFKVESTGALSPEEIVKKTCGILQKKAEDFGSML